MSCGKDIAINKGYSFHKLIETNEFDNTDFSLEGYKIECVIKESPNTNTNLFHLTEENGGIYIIDKITGLFSLSIDADKTNVPASNGVYSVLKIDENFPDTEREILIHGNVQFNKGVI